MSFWICFGITACAHITVPNLYFLHSILMFHPRFDSLSFQFKFVSLGVTPFFLSLVFLLLCFFCCIRLYSNSFSLPSRLCCSLRSFRFCFCFIFQANFLKFECAYSFLFYLFLFSCRSFSFSWLSLTLSNLIRSSVKNCFNSSPEYPKEVPTSIKALISLPTCLCKTL